MIGRIGVSALLALICLVAASSPSFADDMTLFDAFQKFCVATNANPEAANAAAAAAGAAKAAPGRYGNTLVISGSGWRIEQGSHKFLIMTDTLHDVFVDGHTAVTEFCDVSLPLDDGQSVDKAKAWMGVPPTATDPYFYDWELVGAEHRPLPTDKQALADALAGGRLWHGMILRQRPGLTLSVFHKIR